MSKEVIEVDGEDVVVREDTAKASRWTRFAVIIFSGIILIFFIWIVFFSGFLTAVDPAATPTNAANRNANPGP
jgi:hypothetical protein